MYFPLFPLLSLRHGPRSFRTADGRFYFQWNFSGEHVISFLFDPAICNGEQQIPIKARSKTPSQRISYKNGCKWM
jgi:hypothetical protein